MSKCNRGMQLAILFVMALVAAIGIRRFCSNRSLVEETSCCVAASESRSGEKPEDPVTSGKPAETENCVPGDTEAQHGENADSLVPLPTDKPLPYRIKHAVTYGAEGKITVRVVDSKGDVVAGVEVSGGFYNSARPIFEFKETTDGSGLVTITGTCSGDANIRAIKSGFYKSNITYWFFKNYFDCVKDGRWIPWNPTVEIVLKEIRNPVPLYTHRVEALLPKGQEIGFDCLEGDFIIPFGKGENADFYMTYESIAPPNAVTLYDWSFLTNSLSLVATEKGGFITHKKDSFSKMVACYEAPKNRYMRVVDYEMKRTRNTIFVNNKLRESEYLFFKTRVRRKPDGSEEACYGKIYELVFGEHYAETNKAKIEMTYYFNPAPNDRNLEFDGKNNLFKPDWRDTSWPREP